MDVKLESSWKQMLSEEFEKPYFAQLVNFVKEEYKCHTVYPPAGQIFEALNRTPLDQVKVVLLGQDPYHGPGQAHGLSFSVPPGQALPPSLRNMYKELHQDLGIAPPDSGFLLPWAEQGVLLLNATLTVRAHTPGSHQHQGWELFTDAIIHLLSTHKQHLVFVLWGAYAQKKRLLIDGSRHLVIASAHPSPFSADRGFFGSKPFSRSNDYLLQHSKSPIDWSIPNNQKSFF